MLACRYSWQSYWPRDNDVYHPVSGRVWFPCGCGLQLGGAHRNHVGDGDLGALERCALCRTNWGAGRRDRVRRAVFLGHGFALAWGLFAYLILLLFALIAIGLATDDGLLLMPHRLIC